MPDRPLKRDYARVERERCFVLDALPAAIDPESYTRFRDLFVEDSSLRIRRVESPDGDEVVTKVGQKLPDPEAPSDTRRRRLTTIYLPPGEAAALGALRGRSATKRRYILNEGGHTWAVDVWEEPIHRRGLILAEVECDSMSELEAVPAPSWVCREVTGDPAFSAFALAGPVD